MVIMHFLKVRFDCQMVPKWGRWVTFLTSLKPSL